MIYPPQSPQTMNKIFCAWCGYPLPHSETRADICLREISKRVKIRRTYPKPEVRGKSKSLVVRYGTDKYGKKVTSNNFGKPKPYLVRPVSEGND